MIPDVFGAMAEAEANQAKANYNELQKQQLAKGKRQVSAEEELARVWAAKQAGGSTDINDALPAIRDVYAQQGLIDEALKAQTIIEENNRRNTPDQKSIMSTVMALAKSDPEFAKQYAAANGIDMSGYNPAPDYKTAGGVVWRVGANGMPEAVADYRKGTKGTSADVAMSRELNVITKMNELKQTDPVLAEQLINQYGLDQKYPGLKTLTPEPEGPGFFSSIYNKLTGGGQPETPPVIPQAAPAPTKSVTKAPAKARKGYKLQVNQKTGEVREVPL